MHRPVPFLFALALSLSSLASAAQNHAAQPTAANTTPDAAAAGNLAVKRVVLYKNGVGYFEHVGTVRDSQNVTVSFTSGQLDDVLKSLTVLDLDGGRVTGVTYGSSAPIDRQLADLRLSTGEQTTLSGFLGALRGARIEVKTGTAVMTGRLLSIERKTRTGGGTTLEVDYLSLVTDAGEVKTTELSTGFSVRLLDTGLSATVGKYLDLVSSSREPDQRRMTIATSGSGQRRLFVSYISETPIWKSTYRIVLPDKAGQSPLLQGWAIVDNTGGQDWEDVDLSLVAGAPQSFIQKLSLPYYSRRPIVPVKESLYAAPQTFESPLLLGAGRLSGMIHDPSGAVIPYAHAQLFDASGTLIGDVSADADGRYAFPSAPEGQLRLEVQATGFQRAARYFHSAAGQPSEQDVVLQVGSSTETVAVTAGNSTLSSTESEALVGKLPSAGAGGALGSSAMLGRGLEVSRASKMGGYGYGAGSGGGYGGGVYHMQASQSAQASAQDLGDLFEYTLKQPITIRKSQSALVPIVQANVTAEKVSIWNDRSGVPKPLRALWLENTSGNTLDGGSFSVLESDAFAGEGIFDSIRPGEKRLISYAIDLAITPDTKPAWFAEKVTRARLNRGVLVIVKEQSENKTYTFRNEDALSRTVIVEHPSRPDYELRSQTKPVETSSGWMRFRLEVPSKQTASLLVQEAKPVETTYQVASLSDDQVALFVRQRSIDKTLEEALRKVLGQKAVVAGFETEKEARGEETKKIYDDQQRLRENMKALKGSAEERALLQRYTRQLDEQETRLDQLTKEIADLEAKQNAAQADLDKMIDALSFDVKL